MPYKAVLRGYEQSAKVVNSSGVTVAEVFTDYEPGDQRKTAALFAAAADMRDTLRKLVDPAGPLFNTLEFYAEDRGLALGNLPAEGSRTARDALRDILDARALLAKLGEGGE